MHPQIKRNLNDLFDYLTQKLLNHVAALWNTHKLVLVFASAQNSLCRKCFGGGGVVVIQN
jgi:hypothetical protein